MFGSTEEIPKENTITIDKNKEITWKKMTYMKKIVDTKIMKWNIYYLIILLTLCLGLKIVKLYFFIPTLFSFFFWIFRLILRIRFVEILT